MDRSLKKISIQVPDKKYDILLGYQTLGQSLSAFNLKKYDQIGIIISEKVWSLYSSYLKENFLNYQPYFWIMPDGEKNKNYIYAEKFITKILNAGFSRNSLLIAIGGGVVGDFTGFLASIYMRGIDFLQIPTTLLAMVDSSIGGKVAVNVSQGKNIVGSFYQPIGVITDTSFLESLEECEIKNGLAEVFKHGLLGQQKIMQIFRENGSGKFSADELFDLVFEAASFKVSIVMQDVTECGIRAILNFGHTFGHAVESYSNYTIPHGLAVCLGIIMAAEASNAIGLLDNRSVSEILTFITKFDLIGEIPNYSGVEVFKHIKFDKKKKNNKIGFVLLKDLGIPVWDQYLDLKFVETIFCNFFERKYVS